MDKNKKKWVENKSGTSWVSNAQKGIFMIIWTFWLPLNCLGVTEY
jgi:hypothetical protein